MSRLGDKKFTHYYAKSLRSQPLTAFRMANMLQVMFKGRDVIPDGHLAEKNVIDQLVLEYTKPFTLYGRQGTQTCKRESMVNFLNSVAGMVPSKITPFMFSSVYCMCISLFHA